MKRRKAMLGSQVVLAAALALGVTGCDWWYYKVPQIEALWYHIPWFDHMVHVKYVRPYETDSVVRYTPAGTVPVGKPEADWSDEWTHGNPATANQLVNPYMAGGATTTSDARRAGPSVPELPRSVDAAGDTLYQTFCSACHGGAADGHGLVPVGAPSLLTARARAYSDGYLYSMIRYGRGAMPRYGDKVYDPNDRWAIVMHLRKLQAQSPAPVGPAEMAKPLPPGPSMTGSTGDFPQ